MKHTIKNCILKQRDALGKKCEGEQCLKCGWNPKIAEARHKVLKKEGLKLCDDGLKRLIIENEKTGEEK